MSKLSNAIQRALEGATSVEDVDRVKRIITHKINTDALDRYKTVILPRGMQSDNFSNNPTVHFNHDLSQLPIARNASLKVYDRKIVARTQFPRQGLNELADTILEMYADGFLNAWSVSIDPIEQSVPTLDELRKNPHWTEARCVFRKWDLLEYSCVTVPGNQEVTRRAIERGYKLPGWDLTDAERRVEAPGLNASHTPAADALPLLRGRSLDDVAASVTRQLFEQSGMNQRGLFSTALDLAKGRV